MARPAQGYKLRCQHGTGIWHIRWTDQRTGERRDVSLRTRDAAEAARIAPSVCLAELNKPLTSKRAPVADAPLDDELRDMWIDAIRSTIGQRTPVTLRVYWGHWRRAFDTVSGVLDERRIAEYQRARLGVVLKTSLRSEVSALRGFLAWMLEQKFIETIPTIPPIARKATGQRAQAGRKIRATELSPEQVQAVLAALPEWSTGGNGRHAGQARYAVRARWIVAYETGLRPSTIDKLSAPGNYSRGATELVIDDDEDKARFGRVLPLTEAARAALDSVCPREGLLFGEHDFRDYLKRAAREALPPDLARTFSAYDFRHARGTHLLEQTGNLTGVGYLLGHKQATTTNKYARPTKRAAKAVLDAASPPVVLGPVLGPAETQQEATVINNAVRRGGLEPPRCYPLAPQRDALRAIRDDLRDLLGWMTSESDEKRRVENGSGAEPQNVSGPFRIAFAGAA